MNVKIFFTMNSTFLVSELNSKKWLEMYIFKEEIFKIRDFLF